MRDDWVPALDAHLDAFREREFEYGKSDCMIFVLGWLKIATGFDPGETWGDLDDGMAVLKRLGFADWTAAIDSILTRREVVRARTGDIVAHKAGYALGICLGTRCVFLDTVRGLHFSPLNACALAWSVECQE